MVDHLKIYFGDPYPISENITIHQPSIQEIIDYGSDEFFTMLFIFIGNTTHKKLFLWDNDIDWNKLSDFELFTYFAKMLTPQQTSIIFGDLDFSRFDVYTRQDFEPDPEPTAPPGKKVRSIELWKYRRNMFDKAHVLYDPESDIAISADDYYRIAEVLRETVKIYPKTEYAAGKETKQLLIDEEREKIKKAEREKADNTETLLPMISFCVNHPGFKYKLQELRSVGIAEFMDSVKRLQVYESTRAMLNGSTSGFADMSKVPPEQFDFTRNLSNN